ncbi:hypothetical protein SRB5_52710 [Streptomyces sp. RB5]|uniref:Hyaluronidase n=1 Tax=Streptomyces smaragdinus TaxID=2585196 RepID=A0A7K0CP67_9ACTN|nr:beta-N-acetylglucosaminidase domain-containing protein [Streptomyces smaragdinus]MQY15093.1 hypothetical protein [Streptomyces smaragdinus]
MRGRKRTIATAAVLSAAVAGALLGAAPAADAAPSPKGPAPVPEVWPRPQQLRPGGAPVVLAGKDVAVLAAPDTDLYALNVIRAALRPARSVTVASPAAPPPRGTDVVVDVEEAPAGGAADAGPRGGLTPTERALGELGASPQGDLPAGGYRIAARGARVAVSGVGADGLFNAAQTLRQLTAAGRLPGVQVRDWPSAAVRGTAETFYGEPWSHGERLAYLDFMGRTKQNRYLYAPGDDPYRQSKWREPYPAARQAEFRELAARARASHVTLAWAVAPGQDFCFSAAGDREALLRKVAGMRALGVRAFQLQFPDVSYEEWNCGADRAVYGTGPKAAARAQARIANALADALHGGPPLSLLPTEYYQDGATAYRSELATTLDPGVEVAWTGVGVLPRTITGRELAEASGAFRHPLVTQDNYPVNDFDPDRVFLGPYTGREAAVASGSAALLAGAMEQPLATRIPLFTAADFAWNAGAYDPRESWPAAIDDLAATADLDRRALTALARNNASSALDATESAYLRPLLDRFTAAYDSGDRAALAKTAKPLREAFGQLRRAPRDLAALDGELRPWLGQLAREGEAGERAVRMLLAQADGAGALAWRERLALDGLRREIGAGRGRVGEGVLAPFAAKAVAASDTFTGVRSRPPRAADAAMDGRPGTVRRPAPQDRELTLPLGRTALDTLTLLTEPGATAAVALRVPGSGWLPAGKLSPSGFTELRPPRGVRADAVRLSWPGGAAPVVHEVVPWAAGDEALRLELERSVVDVAIGGRAQSVGGRLSGRAPRAVRAALSARAPEGIEVSVPGRVDVPRGASAAVRVSVAVPKGTRPGTYPATVRVAGGETRTLTVRAYRPAAGKDLARGQAAESSGDETPDFPAPAAVDGDPRTRWSSPAGDEAWLRVTLAEPARVGEVVLYWQDAYASRYRVEVSGDGVHWRTGAVVTAGRGGRESVRMDERGVRYVRVVGDERGTVYGYSLWSLEVRAVR